MAIFLKAKRENIIMANYAVPAEVLQPFLPSGVALDLYNEMVYVSLVGFMFRNTKLFNIPIPRLGTFEEINWGFYVLREEGDTITRGVVFVHETIPYKGVAWMANRLYKEHYTAIPTKYSWRFTGSIKHIGYQWKINNLWNNINVEASIAGDTIQANSFEAFIFEHYYGYTKINAAATEEYKLNHPSWKINQVLGTTINCDFVAMYGKRFEFLNTAAPASVFFAEGSAIAEEWKRNRLSLQSYQV